MQLQPYRFLFRLLAQGFCFSPSSASCQLRPCIVSAPALQSLFQPQLCDVSAPALQPGFQLRLHVVSAPAPRSGFLPPPQSLFQLQPHSTCFISRVFIPAPALQSLFQLHWHSRYLSSSPTGSILAPAPGPDHVSSSPAVGISAPALRRVSSSPTLFLSAPALWVFISAPQSLSQPQPHGRCRSTLTQLIPAPALSFLFQPLQP